MRKTVAQTERQERIMLAVTTILSCVGAVFICVSVFSAIIANLDVPDGVVTLMSTLSLCAGCFAAGYTASKRRRKNGLLTGVICGAIIFIVVFILGIIFAGSFSAAGLFTKTIIIIVCSAIGGVAGVNIRTRIR